MQYICIMKGDLIMDTTMETIMFELPKADLKLFKELAKKMGWTISDRKTGIEKALDDVKAGRVYKAKNADDMFKQILG